MAKQMVLVWYDLDHEWHGEIDLDAQSRDGAIAALTKTAVSNWNMTTPWGATKSIELKIYRLFAHSGEMRKEFIRTFHAPLPFAPITDDQYHAEKANILEGVPPEFGNWLTDEAYEEGHSAGMEEVLSLLRSSVDGFMRAFKQYQQRTGVIQRAE
jgi:hypothetical protein